MTWFQSAMSRNRFISNITVSVVIKSKSGANRFIFMRTNAMISSHYFCSRQIKSIQSSFDSLFLKMFHQNRYSYFWWENTVYGIGSSKDMPIYVICSIPQQNVLLDWQSVNKKEKKRVKFKCFIVSSAAWACLLIECQDFLKFS